MEIKKLDKSFVYENSSKINEFVSSIFPKYNILKYKNNNEHEFFYIYYNNQHIGFFNIYQKNRIQKFMIISQYRSKGFGSECVNQIIKYIIQSEIKKEDIHCFVVKSNIFAKK